MKKLASEPLDHQLWKQWEELWQKSSQGHFFNSPTWFVSCLEAFGMPRHLILTCREDGVLCGICPLIYARKFGIPVLAHPGSNFFDLTALLFLDQDDETARLLVAKASTYGNLVISEVGKELSAILETLPGAVSRVCSTSRYLPLDSDPLRYVPRSRKNNLSNRLKRQPEIIKMREHVTNHENLLPIIYDIESKSDKVARARTTFHSPPARRLYEGLSKRQPDQVIINLLYQDDVPVAYEVNFQAKKTRYASQKAYLPHIRKLMPGRQLPLMYLPSLSEQGITTFDLGRGDDDLKREFTPFVAQNREFFFSDRAAHRLWYHLAHQSLGLLEKHPRLLELAQRIKRKIVPH